MPERIWERIGSNSDWGRYIDIFFFFKQKAAYEVGVPLVGSGMCIRNSPQAIYLLESRFGEETNGVLGELSGEEKYAYSDEFYWLDKLDFFPAFQTSSLDNALGISDSGNV